MALNRFVRILALEFQCLLISRGFYLPLILQSAENRRPRSRKIAENKTIIVNIKQKANTTKIEYFFLLLCWRHPCVKMYHEVKNTSPAYIWYISDFSATWGKEVRAKKIEFLLRTLFLLLRRNFSVTRQILQFLWKFYSGPSK